MVRSSRLVDFFATCCCWIRIDHLHDKVLKSATQVFMFYISSILVASTGEYPPVSMYLFSQSVHSMLVRDFVFLTTG